MIVAVREPETGWSLTERAVAGDNAAFGQLLAEHDDSMRAVAYRMLGSATAMDDVLQIAYLKAFGNIGRFRSEASFSTWLNRIVVNACYDWHRSAGRRAEVPLQNASNLEAPGAWEDQVAVGDQLHAALQTLPPDQRAVVILVDGQGHSYSEAAQILEIEHGTVASRLNRARAALRHQLGLGEDANR